MKILSLARFPLHRSSSLRRDRRGFTLIELMITVAIVAILTAIAYPAYRNYVIRGQIVNATNGLTTMAANMERFFQDNRTYATTNGFTSPCTPPGVTYGSFQISCPNALTNPPPAPSPIFTGSTLTATAFQLEAVGVSNSSGNSTGFYYFIDQQGNQGSTVTAPAPSAWIASCAATWETKAGQC